MELTNIKISDKNIVPPGGVILEQNPKSAKNFQVQNFIVYMITSIIL